MLLFPAIIFWTPPHFWALAFTVRTTTRAGVPMLPVTAGPDETRLQILLYTLFLVPLAAGPLSSAMPVRPTARWPCWPVREC